MIEHIDVVVIGAGQAGPSLAVRMAQSGRRVVLIERERLGGTCVNNGCIPTKTLVASARVAHLARRAADFGVSTGEVSVDFAAVMARKDAVVQQSRDSLAQWIAATEGLELIIGEARFTGPRTVAVGDRDLRGGPCRHQYRRRARSCRPGRGSHDAPYLTNRTMMELDRLPEHLVVVGGSYIGLEFAQMFRRFGARVSVVEHADRLIAREDARRQRGGARPPGERGDRGPSGRARLRGRGRAQGGAPDHHHGRQVRRSAGRRPAARGGTHAQRREAEPGRAPGSNWTPAASSPSTTSLRTSAEGVYALGDVNGHGAFTHTSYNDFEILAANLLDGEARRLSDRLSAYALFIDPPLGARRTVRPGSHGLGRKV